MRFLSGLLMVLFLAGWGCSSSTGTDQDHNGGDGDNGEETEEYELSVSASPDEGGSVDPSNGTYQEGAEVTVEATPRDNWTFTEWSGDKEGDENPITFTINSDTELMANFESSQSEYTIAMTLNDGSWDESFFYFDFGQAEGATRGFDEAYDEKAPPPPPDDAFHAFFNTDSLELFDDFRSSLSTETTWNLNYQISENDTLFVQWELQENLPEEGSMILTDQDQSFQTNMLEERADTVIGTSEGTLLFRYQMDQ